MAAVLRQGQTLSTALSQFPQAFPPLYIATVKASEKTSDLAPSLARYVAYSSQLEAIRKRVVNASIYPALLKLEQEGAIASSWGVSDNNRKAKFYRLTRAGLRQVEKETRDWQRTTDILSRFLAPGEPS